MCRGAPRVLAGWLCRLFGPLSCSFFFFFQAEDGIRDTSVTGVQTCALPILAGELGLPPPRFTGESGGPRRPVTPDRVISNAKAKAMLDWRPRYPTFREGYANRSEERRVGKGCRSRWGPDT